METIVLLTAAGFFAATIDAAVGGGGLITLPALMLVTLDPHLALGTNKFSACFGAAISFYTFYRSRYMDRRLAKKLFPLAFVGSLIGVLLVQQISSEFLNPLIAGMLVVIFAYTVFKKDWEGGKEEPLTHRKEILAMLMAAVIGFYDGFFGPGTGSFLLFGFLLLGFNFLTASAQAKALNFASNIAAALLFAASGMVDYAIALPMAAAMLVGGRLGAKLAISKGVKYIRRLFIIVTAVLIIKEILVLAGF